MIGFWHDDDHLSVCRSAALSTVVIWVGASPVGVESCTVMLIAGHFLFISSDTFALRCVISPQNTAIG